MFLEGFRIKEKEDSFFKMSTISASSPTPKHELWGSELMEQLAQRATIAHQSPMCQGQISFQKIQTHPSFNACSCYMKVSKGSNQKQQRKSGNIIFPIISLWGYFLYAQGQLTP